MMHVNLPVWAKYVTVGAIVLLLGCWGYLMADASGIFESAVTDCCMAE